MYSIADYGSMIADDVRMAAFARALRQTLTPGAVVVDIGTGTGIFAMLACGLGARRVYAIEPSDAIEVAREIAAANGYADRIEFMQALSTDVTLPERADVIISDIGGALPWFAQHIPSIVDARRRFLAPSGALIPQRDVGWAAVVEVDEFYARLTRPWDTTRYGLDMTAARHIVVNAWQQVRLTNDNLLSDLQRWVPLDYAVVEDPDVKTELTWTVPRAGTGHGFAAGFDRTLSEGVHLSNAPDAPPSIRPDRIYGTVFFPWPAPVPLTAGDRVTIQLEARLSGGGYIWSWKTAVRPRGQSQQADPTFVQSTFFGVPLSPATLKKGASGYVPILGEDGRMTRFVLNLMQDGVSVGEIATRLLSGEFATRFPRLQDALAHVATLSRRYC